MKKYGQLRVSWSHSDTRQKYLQAVTATSNNYSRPLAIVTTLFFMWGFLTCLNDILVPHLKSIFELSYAKAMLIQFAFFSAYFLFSVPWSRIVNTIGYKTTMVVGLLTMAVWRILVCARRICCLLPLVSDRTACSRRGDYRSAGVGQSLCGSVRQTGNGIEPAGPDPGFQFAGHHNRAENRGTADPELSSFGDRTVAASSHHRLCTCTVCSRRPRSRCRIP